jgi:hypothetical protein
MNGLALRRMRPERAVIVFMIGLAFAAPEISAQTADAGAGNPEPSRRLVLPGSTSVQRQCLDWSRATVARLLRGAERVVGRKLNVVGPDSVLVARIDGGEVGRDDEMAYATFRVDEGDGRINIYDRTFCRLSEPDRLATLAHELGHVADNALGGNLDKPCPSFPCLWPAWEERGHEIRATAYAYRILNAAGVDPGLLDRHYAGRGAYLARVRQELERQLAAGR